MTARGSAPASPRTAATLPLPSLRWSLPAGLLVAEYAVLSLLVDFPTSGPALGLASAGRMLVPAALGAAAAGWLLSRQGRRAALHEAGALPPWRPGLPLVAQLGAFAFTVWLALRVLGPGEAPATAGGLLAIGGAAAACAVLALATAAPLAWLARLAWRHLGAPVMALAAGLLAWKATALAEGLWGVLGDSTLRGVGTLLVAVNATAVVRPDESIVGLGGFEVVIAPVCSGVDGLGLVLVFQALWLSLARARLRIRRAVLLLPIGAAAALGANVLRIAALVLLGASGRPELAVGAFHSKLGWLLFVAIAVGTVAVAEHVAWFRRPDADAAMRDDGVPRKAGAYAGPLLAAIAVALLTSLWAEGGLDRWYAASPAAALVVLLAVRQQLPSPSLALSWTAVLVGAGVGTAWILWTRGDAAGLETFARLAPAAQVAWVAARVLGSCVVVPLVEELAFRGFLLPWIVSPEFESVPPRAWTWTAVIVSSLAFGAMHADLVLGTLAGAAFAWTRLRRGRLSDAVLAHAVANAVIAAFALSSGDWSAWS